MAVVVIVARVAPQRSPHCSMGGARRRRRRACRNAPIGGWR